MSTRSSARGSQDHRTALHVVNDLRIGGAERTVVALCGGLAARGWDVHVAVSETGGALETTLQEVGVPLHHIVHSWPLGLDGMANAASLARALGADVVHTHLIASDIVGGVGALLARVPVVLSTQHDTIRRAPHKRFYKRVAARLSSGIVACSAPVRDFCIKTFGVPDARLFQIDNGIDVARFAPGHVTGPVSGTLRLVSVGSLTENKDHATAVAAVSALRERGADISYRIVGEGPCRRALEDQLADSSLGDMVRLRGQELDVPAVLADADAFVHPSRSEGQPLAVLEAMAAGLPIVAARNAGVEQVVAEGETGRLFEPGDVAELARILGELAASPQDVARLGRAAREHAVARYSVERMVDEYEALYLRLLGDVVA